MSDERCPACNGELSQFVEIWRQDQRCLNCDFPYRLWKRWREMQAEIERLRTLAVRASHSFRSTLPHPWCQDGLRNADIEELVKLAEDTREGE